MSSSKEKKKADKTILAITDFSKSSTNAIIFAAGLFKDINPKLQLLNIFDSPDEKDAPLISVEDILSKDSETGLKKQALEITSALKNPALDIATFSVSGRLKKVISNLAQNGNINLIVAGISGDKYLCKQLNNKPLLFMSPNRVPVLLVPEKTPQKPVDKIAILNLDTHTSETGLKKEFEKIVNHDHVSKNVIALDNRKPEKTAIASIHKLAKEDTISLFVIAPAANDNIDRALLNYRIQELLPSVASLLNC